MGYCRLCCPAFALSLSRLPGHATVDHDWSRRVSGTLAQRDCSFKLILVALYPGSKKTRAQRRKGGWKIVSGLTSIHSILQIISIAIILHVYRTDSRFGRGSHLDTAADLAIASALISIVNVVGLTVVGLAARKWLRCITTSTKKGDHARLIASPCSTEAGKEWAGGKPRKHKHRRHRRTRSGRLAPDEVNEETGLLQDAEDGPGVYAEVEDDQEERVMNGTSGVNGSVVRE